MILHSPIQRASALTALVLAFTAPHARAQLSFASAIDLAVTGNARVRSAQADVVKAHNALAETHDAYKPAISGVIQPGYSYGAPLGEPRLFSFSAQSLVFNFAQKDYIRAAVAGLQSANDALDDAREEVAEDTAITYLSLASDQQRRATLVDEFNAANSLAHIVEDRINAGQDTKLELLQAQRTARQVTLQLLLLDDEIDNYRVHLLHLTGMPDGPLITQPASIPPMPSASAPVHPFVTTPGSPQEDLTPAVAAAFANARAKQQQAFGDARYLWRPQIAFFAEYSRFSTFNNYQVYYPAFSTNTLNAIGIGVQITVPFYDPLHQDKARESAADAVHAQQQAILARDQMFEGRTKLTHASAELAARSDVASIDQQIAQAQLDAVLIQLQAGNGNPNATPPSPKDEQNARIQERQRTLDLIDTRAKLLQTQIQLLRLTGQLEPWIKSAIQTNPTLPTAPAPQLP